MEQHEEAAAGSERNAQQKDTFDEDLRVLAEREQEFLKGGPHIRLRAFSYQVFELVDDLLHLGVAAILVGIAALVFAHILLTGLNGLALTGPSVTFFQVILTDVNDVLFVVIVLEILATVVAHLRSRTFALRPLITIGIISAVRHILIVTVHLSAEQNAMQADLFTQQILELLGTTLVTVLLVACYWFVTRADILDRDVGAARN